MTFEKWMLDVEQALLDTVGMGPDDLPDTAYAEFYADEFTPQHAALQALADSDDAGEEAIKVFAKELNVTGVDISPRFGFWVVTV